MFKARRKSDTCLNCDHHFNKNEKDNYCPNCGQENTNLDVSFSLLVKDFISSHFSLDTKLLRTLKLLLLKPGLLTLFFNEGKRVSYTQPIRLVLVSGLVYFSIFSTQFLQNKNNDIHIELPYGENTEDVEKQEAGEKENDNSPIFKINLGEGDTLHSRQWNNALNRVIQLGEKYPVEQSMDSLIQEKNFLVSNFFGRQVIRQGLKVYRQGGTNLSNYFWGSLPIMILIFIPFFALEAV